MLEFLNKVKYNAVVDYDLELYRLKDGTQLCDFTVEFGGSSLNAEEEVELQEIINDFKTGLILTKTVIGSQVYELVDNKTRLTVLYQTESQ